MLERINKTLTLPETKNSKVMILADLHFHKHRASNVFLPIIEMVLDQCIKAIETHGIEILFFLGDWFENKEKIGTEEFVLTSRFLYELKRRNVFVVMIPGNHDKFLKSNSKTIMTTIEGFNMMDNVVCVSDWTKVYYKNKVLHFVPHSDSLKKTDVIEKLDNGKENYFFGHPEMNDITMSNDMKTENSLTDLDVDYLNSVFKMSFLGHYHNAKKYGNVITVGSPYQQNFGESNNKNFILVWDLDTDKITAIPNTWSPKFIKLLVDGLNIKTDEDIQKIDIKNSFVRIILNKAIDSNLLVKLKEHLGRSNHIVEILFDYEEKSEPKINEQNSDDLRRKLKIVDLSNTKNIKDFYSTYLNVFKALPEGIEKDKLKSLIDEVS